ncbi:MAG: SsrA-binding protein SmpB [Chloroflexota bacterium]|nr:MAG: SsrA-binding protein SmpB [Chloroflexota bacterium]
MTSASKTEKSDLRVVATNRKAYHDYFIEETYEAGIALTGTEIKSVRAGAVNLRDAYATVQNGEMLLQNVHISPYEAGNRFNVDPYRTRKLLLHRKEINRLMGRVQEKGLTIVPLRMYLKKNRAKVELALVKGKRQYDKRESISKRDADREIERAMKERERE